MYRNRAADCRVGGRDAALGSSGARRRGRGHPDPHRARPGPRPQTPVMPLHGCFPPVCAAGHVPASKRTCGLVRQRTLGQDVRTLSDKGWSIFNLTAVCRCSAGPAAHAARNASATLRPPYACRMTKVLAAVAWPYANSPRHLGHVAGFGVPSDVFARYMRMAGHEVLMVSGSDEHGTPSSSSLTKGGRHGPELVDKNHAIIAHGWRISAAPTTSTPEPQRSATMPLRRTVFFTGVDERLHDQAHPKGRDLAEHRRTLPTAISRAPARSAATAGLAATSATTAARQLEAGI